MKIDFNDQQRRNTSKFQRENKEFEFSHIG